MGDARSIMNATDSGCLPPSGLAEEVYRWDFDVFELTERGGGQPLRQVTMALLEDQGLLDGWLLDRPTVERYLATVESIYKPNPYHNHTHAADVTQTAGVIMSSLDQHLRGPTCNNTGSNGSGSPTSCGCCASCCCGARCVQPGNAGSPQLSGTAAGANSSSSSSAHNNSHDGGRAAAAAAAAPGLLGSGGLSKLERFAVILASAVHDLGHPGVNNAYLVRTRDAQALTYNDRSVNENMHASLAFKLALEHEGLNLFAAFSQEQFETVRRLVLEMVLSTDMDVHFALLKRFEEGLAAAPDVRTWSSLEQRSLLFQMLVHLADLANPSRPWHLALRWAEWVVTEFLAQGDKEAGAGIPISPPCDSSKVCMPAAQLFFIERFCGPTLAAFRPAAPSFYDMAAPWLADTSARWAAFKEAGVRFPCQGYPTLPPRTELERARLWTSLRGTTPCCGACRQQHHSSAPAGMQGDRRQQHQQHQQQQAATTVAAGSLPPAAQTPAQQPLAAIQLPQAAAQAAG